MIKYDTYLKLYSEAIGYGDNFEMYVAERGWQEWMNNIEDPSEVLISVYKMAHMSIADVRKAMNLSQMMFSQFVGIPKRTIEDWEAGKRRINPYQLCMISYIVWEMLQEDKDDNEDE